MAPTGDDQLSSTTWPEALVISDSRFSKAELAGIPGWKLRTLSVSGLNLRKLTDLVTMELRSNTRLLLICALHCDLSYRMKRPNKTLGLLRAHQEPVVQDIFNRIHAYSYTWQHEKDLSVFWGIPCPAQMVKYNSGLAKRRGQNKPVLLQKEEWTMDSRTMAENIQKLKDLFVEKRVAHFDLAEYGCNLQEKGSDGVHMTETNKNEVLNTILKTAVALHPCKTIPKAKKPHTVGRKIALTLRSRRYRQIKAAKRKSKRAAEPCPTAGGRLESDPQPSTSQQYVPFSQHQASASMSRHAVARYDPYVECPPRFEGRSGDSKHRPHEERPRYIYHSREAYTEVSHKHHGRDDDHRSQYPAEFVGRYSSRHHARSSRRYHHADPYHSTQGGRVEKPYRPRS